MIPGTIPTSYLVPTADTEATGVVSLSARSAMLNNMDSAPLSNGGDVDLYDAFYQRLLALPESSASETLKDSIYQEMNAFKSPNSGDSTLVSVDSPTSVLQNYLAKLQRVTHV
ncbi:type III secretion system effector protein OrgC, partial [Salmonella enterica]|uniref:type III secretion system effector protein OrgC n=1 Tax=Salmonella enterica TaxID=28901 RepID=UPI00398C5FBA